MLLMYLSMMESEEEKLKLEEFYTKNHNFLLNHANKILMNREKAEDAVHEAFIAMIKNKDKYLKLEKKDLRRVGVVIVRNKCIDILAEDKRYADVPYDELDIYLESTEAPVDEKIADLDELETMKTHINSLDELSKQVLILKYIQDMSYNDISEITGLSVKNIDMRLYRAKKKIKELMGGGRNDDEN